MAGLPHHVARAGQWMVVADNSRGMSLMCYGRTRGLMTKIPVGAEPHGVAEVPTWAIGIQRLGRAGEGRRGPASVVDPSFVLRS